ncbi:ATP-grasp fold amidoligase family protein [Jannaschia aquimarina]|uniref:TupA-like ATPgrasp n=1 Tax=Jannaschia aquimarina TaxID=935700 RepID=A0A0D1EL17_9RHOB|nr:ATP-grasp fold amidoligase family protein [Jannaschia aquimarina]KIT17676.1 hypothetical protein jaqu_05670 [Jannaschia aquimarina]SNS79302.1 TupA-like ATPgrasp [Jannaschia aquimarina]
MNVKEAIDAALRRIFEEGLHGTRLPTPVGYARGFERFGDGLADAMGPSVRIFRRGHGDLPDLIAPRRFTERQLLFKFFAPIPLMSPSDKLGSRVYLPDAYRDRIRQPKVLWRSQRAELPANEAFPPGDVWFKSNHGSGTNQCIRYPLEPRRRRRLEATARDWLTRVHNARLALWWYESMDRFVYLEEDLRPASGESAADWKFFVCNGRVALFQHDADRFGDHIQTLYDREGRFIPHELYAPTGDPVPMPDDLDIMIEAAEAVGQHFDFIRVDMFRLGETIYLGEIGLVPNGGRTPIRSPEIEERLAAAWSPPWLGEVDADAFRSYYEGRLPAEADATAQAS